MEMMLVNISSFKESNMQEFENLQKHYIWGIQDMYYGVTTSVSLRGKTNDFPLGIELHQGLALSL